MLLFQTLHQSDSMVSLCFRSLANYINDDNLSGLQSFLESKQVQVDDRDDVSFCLILHIWMAIISLLTIRLQGTNCPQYDYRICALANWKIPILFCDFYVIYQHNGADIHLLDSGAPRSCLFGLKPHIWHTWIGRPRGVQSKMYITKICFQNIFLV